LQVREPRRRGLVSTVEVVLMLRAPVRCRPETGQSLVPSSGNVVLVLRCVDCVVRVAGATSGVLRRVAHDRTRASHGGWFRVRGGRRAVRGERRFRSGRPLLDPGQEWCPQRSPAQTRRRESLGPTPPGVRPTWRGRGPDRRVTKTPAPTARMVAVQVRAGVSLIGEEPKG